MNRNELKRIDEMKPNETKCNQMKLNGDPPSPHSSGKPWGFSTSSFNFLFSLVNLAGRLLKVNKRYFTFVVFARVGRVRGFLAFWCWLRDSAGGRDETLVAPVFAVPSSPCSPCVNRKQFFNEVNKKIFYNFFKNTKRSTKSQNETKGWLVDRRRLPRVQKTYSTYRVTALGLKPTHRR